VTPRALAAAVAGADFASVRAAVRACAEYLRTDDLGEDRRALAEVLVGLLSHEDPEVRHEVAEACDLLPDPYFGRALEALIVDPDGFVKNAARRAGDRRARRRKAREKDDAQERVMGDLLQELGAGHRKATRRIADRAVRRGVELFVARLDHELRKPRGAIESALALLAREADRPDLSPAEVRRLAAELGQAFALVGSIVQRSGSSWSGAARWPGGSTSRSPWIAISPRTSIATRSCKPCRTSFRTPSRRTTAWGPSGSPSGSRRARSRAGRRWRSPSPIAGAA
jgi:hypothetical protein